MIIKLLLKRVSTYIWSSITFVSITLDSALPAPVTWPPGAGAWMSSSQAWNYLKSHFLVSKWSLGVSTMSSMTTTRPHLCTATSPLATGYGWASASIRDAESACELYPCSICAILNTCQLLPGRGLVLDFILHIFLLFQMKWDLIQLREWGATLLPRCYDGSRLNTCRGAKVWGESLRIGGGGGRTSVPGAADRSVPMAVGVGVRSTVVNRSGTLLCLQKIGNHLCCPSAS